MARPRRIAGAVFLDLAISTLFLWNVFVEPLAETLDARLTDVNYVFAVGLAAFSAGVIAGGWLADRLPPRRLAFASGVGMVVGLGLAAWAPSLFWIGLGFGVIKGAAAGVGYATAVHEAGMVNRGMSLALVVSAYGVGSAVLAQPVAWLLAEHGYPAAFVFLALFSALTCTVAGCLLSGQYPEHDAHANSQRVTPASGEQTRELTGVLALFWLMFGFGSVPGLVAFALASAFSGGAAYAAVIAVNLGNMGGRLIAGALNDRLGNRLVLHGHYGLLVIACLVVLFASGAWVALLGLLLLGLQYGALSTLLPLSVRAHVPVGIFGRCFGIVFSAWGVCGLLAPVAATALIHLTGVSWVLYAMLGCGLFSWLAMVGVHPTAGVET